MASSIRPNTKGALHATEIPFLFETVRAKYGEATTADDEKLAAAPDMYWTSSAKTGSPAGEGLPAWPRYTEKDDQLLDFALTGPAAKADPWRARLDWIEKYASVPTGR